jgi:PAS domain S-box-containing protein
MVAAKAGDSIIEVLKKHGIGNIVEYPSYEKIIKAAEDGEVKVFTVDRPPALYFLNRMGIQNNFRETAPMDSGEFHRAVLKGNGELLVIVEKGFAAMTSGELQAIEKRWMGAPLGGLQLRYLWHAVGAMTLLGAVIAGWLVILKKLVRRKTKELAESELRYRKLVEQSTAWIWKTDAALKYTFSNDNVEKMLGYSATEMRALDIRQLVHPDDHETLRKTIQEAVGAGRGWSGLVLRWQRRDGAWRSIESSGVPLFDDTGTFTGLQGVDTDITDQLNLEEEHEKMERLESLGLLAGGIAHDFNNILTGIVGNLSLARMMIDDGHRAAARLEECEKAAQRASELTQQLLTFARGGEPVKKTVDLSRLINEAVSFGLHGSRVKGVLELEDTLWSVDADEGQLSQVLNNLLINAAQAMPDGGIVTVSGENICTDDAQGRAHRFVRVTVRDTGSGISPDVLVKIFDPYFTTKAHGSGLGLASVHSIITRHGGTIQVSSEIGKGTEFVLCLPAAEKTAPQEQSAVSLRFSDSAAAHVLVMDDEEMIVEVLSMMLDELGYVVATCSDGADAVKLYQAAIDQGKRYDVVILDLTVPGGMGGLEAARRIKKIDPASILVVSSGYSHDAVMADPGGHGFSGLVMKPYSMTVLGEELDRVLHLQNGDNNF